MDVLVGVFYLDRVTPAQSWLLFLSQRLFLFVMFAEIGVAGAEFGLSAARRGGRAAAIRLGQLLEKAGNAGTYRLRA